MDHAKIGRSGFVWPMAYSLLTFDQCYCRPLQLFIYITRQQATFIHSNADVHWSCFSSSAIIILRTYGYIFSGVYIHEYWQGWNCLVCIYLTFENIIKNLYYNYTYQFILGPNSLTFPIA